MVHAKRFLFLILFGILIAGSVSAQVFGMNFTTQMAIYKNYGLLYDSGKGAYCYNNKIVGLFVDEKIQRRVFLHPASEIHVKVNRDLAGKITGITELSSSEYAKVMEDLEAMQMAFIQRRNGIRDNMNQRLNDRKLRQLPPLPPMPRFFPHYQ
jgi:hypothetical protein